MATGSSRAASLDVGAIRADIEALFATEIFSFSEVRGAVFKASYIWLILNLHELLQFLSARDARVVLADRDTDVTDLIQRARYAVVHMAGGARSRSRVLPLPAFYEVAAGEPSGFSDDIAVQLGGVKILLRRDAVAAFNAACMALDGAQSRANEWAHQ
jgi:hypothetical protein